MTLVSQLNLTLVNECLENGVTRQRQIGRQTNTITHLSNVTHCSSVVTQLILSLSQVQQHLSQTDLNPSRGRSHVGQVVVCLLTELTHIVTRYGLAVGIRLNAIVNVGTILTINAALQLNALPHCAVVENRSGETGFELLVGRIFVRTLNRVPLGPIDLRAVLSLVALDHLLSRTSTAGGGVLVIHTHIAIPIVVRTCYEVVELQDRLLVATSGCSLVGGSQLITQLQNLLTCCLSVVPALSVEHCTRQKCVCSTLRYATRVLSIPLFGQILGCIHQLVVDKLPSIVDRSDRSILHGLGQRLEDNRLIVALSQLEVEECTEETCLSLIERIHLLRVSRVVLLSGQELIDTTNAGIGIGPAVEHTTVA